MEFLRNADHKIDSFRQNNNVCLSSSIRKRKANKMLLQDKNIDVMFEFNVMMDDDYFILAAGTVDITRYTVKCRYNAAQFIAILHMALG